MDERKPLPAAAAHGVHAVPRATGQRQDVAAQVELKATIVSSLLYYSIKRSVPGGFNVGLIGSTCTALPGIGRRRHAARPSQPAAGGLHSSTFRSM